MNLWENRPINKLEPNYWTFSPTRNKITTAGNIIIVVLYLTCEASTLIDQFTLRRFLFVFHPTNIILITDK